jgi:hypothetical protein
MLILFLGCYIHVNQGKFAEVSDIHVASIFRVIVRVQRGGEILSIYTIPFCKTVGKGERVEISALSGPTGPVDWESYALECTKKTDWQLIFQSNCPSKCSPGITLLNFLWCVSSSKERGREINMG